MIPKLVDEKGFDLVFNYISALSDQPNDNTKDPLSAAQLKAKFDAAGNDLVAYINNTLIPAIDSDIASAIEGIGSGGQIITDKIADGAVTASKLAALAVVTAAIADLAVTTAKIADKAVTGAKIADKTIVSANMADGAVIRNTIADDAVSTNKIYNGAVTNAKIANEAVGESKIIIGSVSSTYKFTLAASEWTDSDGLYTQSKTETALNDTCKVVVDADTDGLDSTAAQDVREEFGGVLRVTVEEGKITFIFFEKPIVDIPVKVLSIKK